MSIKRAFESLGHEVELHFLNFEGPFYMKGDTVNWLKYGVLPDKFGIDFFIKNSRDKYNKQLKNILNESKIDLVVVIKGLTLDIDVFDNYTGHKVLWVLDSIMRFPEIQMLLPIFDHVYSYEYSDIEFCKQNLNIEIKNLSVAYDPNLYMPLQRQLLHRISFVGGRKPNREEFVTRIAKELPMALVGDFYKSSNSKVRKNVVARKAGHIYINELYNSSLINLNIHKPQSQIGVNPRFFEILGAGGGIQFVEPKRAFDTFKDGIDLIYYNSVEECIDKAKFYHNNESLCRKIASSGHMKVIKSHTWSHRVAQIISDLN